MPDYYELLGVSRDATPDEIHERYKKLAKKMHPDIPGSDLSAFNEIKQAHDVLMDSTNRAVYDRTGLDPDDTQNATTLHALLMIRQTMQSMLHRTGGELSSWVNVVSSIRGTIADQHSAIDNEIKSIERANKKLADGKAMMTERWSNRSGDDLVKRQLLCLFDDAIRNNNEKSSRIRQQLIVVDAALQLLEGCEYKTDIDNDATYGVSFRERQAQVSGFPPIGPWIENWVK